MVENPNHPKPDDAVLGGQAPPPVYAAVLGGIGSVKHYLENEAKGNGNQRMAALSQALKYGKDGLELLMSALTHKSWCSMLQSSISQSLTHILLRN